MEGASLLMKQPANPKESPQGKTLSYLIRPLLSEVGCDGAGGGPSLMSREGVSAEARLIPDGKETLN